MNTQDSSTVDRIIKASAKLFAEKGYDGTTTREIVKEAGASLSSLQFHFQSKENLYFTAVDQALARQHTLLKPIFDEIDAAEQQGMLNNEVAWNLLVSMIGKMSDWIFLEEERNSILLMNREMLNPSKVFRSVPERGMLIHLYFQKLFESYVGTQQAFWTKLLSFSVVMSIFDYANYPSVLRDVLDCDISTPENTLQIKLLMKSSLLVSLRAYLDSFKTE